jgi:hypothetical protein
MLPQIAPIHKKTEISVASEIDDGKDAEFRNGELGGGCILSEVR